ncbi:MAG: 3-ketoacyl-ACP reductase [Terriglobales bacterium]|jgi:NAD(P)-dependent dehydrogenase (short-subunit alcohol dehydrogenase family)|nr:3-ketoacyl-ACP reductase [Terriglobales bacterium]
MTTKKVALVTGGTRGIGLGIARSLARADYDLVICGVREVSAVTEAIAEIQNSGADVFYVQADVSDKTARHHLIAATRKHFGRLNLLINNAGIAPKPRADILDATEESFDEVIGINLRGPFFLTQEAAKWMIEQRRADAKYWGAIVNISSVSATVASTNRGDYCISKAGVAMATKLWAARLGEFDIPVYEVRPGIIKTDMTASVVGKYEKLLSEGAAIQPRWGTPEDVGRVVASLARGEFPYSTGSVFMVDGGMTVQRI